MSEPNCLGGNADMYGIGIRLGFYIQWLVGSVAAYLGAKDEVESTRFALFGFTLATFLAVVVLLGQPKAITTLDIYISLLLAFGYFYFFLVRVLWRLYIGRDQSRDYFRMTASVASPEFDILQKLLLLAVTGMKIWFWTARVKIAPDPKCTASAYGFLFYPLPLDGLPMRIFNLVIDIGMILPLFGELASAIKAWTESRQARTLTDTNDPIFPREIPLDNSDDEIKKRALRFIMGLRLVISFVIIIATELTIKWNGLDDMFNLNSAGQMIPLMLGVITVLHFLYRRK